MRLAIACAMEPILHRCKRRCAKILTAARLPAVTNSKSATSQKLFTFTKHKYTFLIYIFVSPPYSCDLI